MDNNERGIVEEIASGVVAEIALLPKEMSFADERVRGELCITVMKINQILLGGRPWSEISTTLFGKASCRFLLPSCPLDPAQAGATSSFLKNLLFGGCWGLYAGRDC